MVISWAMLMNDEQSTSSRLVLNYPNSNAPMMYTDNTMFDLPSKSQMIYFYDNGNTLLKITQDQKGEPIDTLTWDNKGKKAEPKKIISTIKKYGYSCQRAAS